MHEAIHDIDTAFKEAIHHHESGRLQQAREIYAQILEADPNHPDALDHSGVIADAFGDNKTALTLISKAIRLHPKNPFYYNNLGNALRSRGEFMQAEAAFRKALLLKPDLMECLNNLGNVLKDLNRLNEAVHCFQQALTLKPDYAEAHYNLSLTLLAKGNYLKGWEEYEWRFRKAGWRTIYPYRFIKPIWEGESFAGKTLFVHNEQGFGDIIQFIRYLPMVKDCGGTVILETRSQLFELMKGFPGVDELVVMSPHGKPLEDFDFYVPLLTLPKVFGTRLETIPSQVPYIFAGQDKMHHWKNQLPKSGFKVGIVWAGKPMHRGIRKRACSLGHFLCMRDIPGVHLIGLQHGEAAGQADHYSDQMDFINLGGSFRDFADTAGVIENLDLVISIDTSVAHLAGAMGKPVWILLPFSPDWRWMLQREDSPWYPTARLFRQTEPGNWDAVFRKVSESLRTHLKDQRPPESVHSRRSAFDTRIVLSRAVQFHQSGDLSAARELYEKILKRDPNDGDALHLLGLIAHETGKYKIAEDLISKAVNLFPDDPYYQNSLGLVYTSMEKPDKATGCYKTALLLKPDMIEAANNLGVLCQDQGRLDEATEWFEKALKCDPNMPVVYNNLGNTLKDMGKIDAAITRYEKALALNPEYTEVYNNMGVAFQNHNQYEAALSSYQKALKLRPDYAEAHINTGITHQYMGDPVEALSCFQKALEVEPDNAAAHFHCGFVLLLMANLQQGWKEYEWRLQKDEWKKNHIYHHNARFWDGSKFEDESLFIHAEQGLGDTLQFVRYLPIVKHLGGKVIFEVNRNLAGLFEGLPGIDELVTLSSAKKPTADYDLYVPLMSIPGLFKTTLETIPADVPYLFANPAKAEYWRSRLDGPDLKIGLVWAGKPVVNDNRPCKLNHFQALFRVPGVHIWGLQKGAASIQVRDLPDGMDLINIGEGFKDFTDTAAAIENMDLVISIDTSVAHLAGAMGKPVWTLLPYAPDWRWLLNRDDSPWYPTMRLFRQPNPGDWESVIGQVAKALENLVQNRV